MRPYLISLAVGLLAGGIYGLLNVRSPAPPVIALIGLFGMLLGEQLVPLARDIFRGRQVAAMVRANCTEILGPQAGPCPQAEEG